jgi:hypothetical protein
VTTPNPAVSVNSLTPPQDTTASATVNVALLSSAGAVYWFLTCVGADDLTSVATINASISINLSAKTATFTAPNGAGQCVIMQSTVGIGTASQAGFGTDANNQVQPLFTTTFKVNVATAGGLHVIASNEKLEQDSVYGWINEINKALRAVSGAVVPVPPWVTVTATGTTLTNGQSGSSVRANTTGGAYSILLPASPTDGTTFAFVDPLGTWNTNNLTINGNGNSIVNPAQIGGAGGTAATIALSIKRASVVLKWDATNSLWQVGVS